MPARYDSELENAILRTLSYFDIFNYPLKVSEVYNFLPMRASKSEVEQMLTKMSDEKQIMRKQDLYSVQFDHSLFDRRIKGNLLADSLLPDITAKAKLIFKFPFVRAVMASGSFSKNFMDEKSDFDFFIVCAPQRVWVSRMLLVFYKKLFLKNSHRYFCINYFIDESSHEIDEKNIFTATELGTVLPLTGYKHYAQLMSANRTWMLRNFPNYQQRTSSDAEPRNGLIKIVSEKIIDIFGDQLNQWFKLITLNRWKKIYGNTYASADFNVAFKSTDNVSKNHPRNFQKRIIEEFQARVNGLSKKAEVYE